MIRHVLGTALALVATLAVARASVPTLEEVRVDRKGDAYDVSARLEGGVTRQLLDEIEAGIETTFRYRVQLLRRRSGLPDDPLERHVVECSVRHDALSRQYTLTRRLDDEVVEKRVTGDAAEMRAFLTTLSPTRLGGVAEFPAGTTIYARVRCEMGLVWKFYLIPWRLNTDWVKVPVAPPPPDEHVETP